jgi:hypothetical protein
MDNFALKPEKKKGKRRSFIWDILAILILLGTCYLAYFFITIFANPYSPHNPFPPAALPTLFQTATPTNTVIPKLPTWTPTQTITPVATRTKAPTWTLVPLVSTPTITMTPTPMPAVAIITYQAGTTKHVDLGCNWMGVGGSVVDANNKGLLLQNIQLGGTLEDKDVTVPAVVSGSNPSYGLSGFEFEKLADKPVASKNTLWIQLLDDAGQPLTDKIFFDTYDDCAKNLVIINFTKFR